MSCGKKKGLIQFKLLLYIHSSFWSVPEQGEVQHLSEIDLQPCERILCQINNSASEVGRANSFTLQCSHHTAQQLQ